MSAHAPRLQGHKIWKRAGLRTGNNGSHENTDAAQLELAREGGGARKKARVEGSKQNILDATWKDNEGRVEMTNGAMSPAKRNRMSILGGNDDALVVPRKRTNANHLITPKRRAKRVPLEDVGAITRSPQKLQMIAAQNSRSSPKKITLNDGTDVLTPTLPEKSARRRKSLRKSSRRSTLSTLDEHFAVTFTGSSTSNEVPTEGPPGSVSEAQNDVVDPVPNSPQSEVSPPESSKDESADFTNTRVEEDVITTSPVQNSFTVVALPSVEQPLADIDMPKFITTESGDKSACIEPSTISEKPDISALISIQQPHEITEEPKAIRSILPDNPQELLQGFPIAIECPQSPRRKSTRRSRSPTKSTVTPSARRSPRKTLPVAVVEEEDLVVIQQTQDQEAISCEDALEVTAPTLVEETFEGFSPLQPSADTNIEVADVVELSLVAETSDQETAADSENVLLNPQDDGVPSISQNGTSGEVEEVVATAGVTDGSIALIEGSVVVTGAEEVISTNQAQIETAQQESIEVDSDSTSASPASESEEDTKAQDLPVFNSLEDQCLTVSVPTDDSTQATAFESAIDRAESSSNDSEEDLEEFRPATPPGQGVDGFNLENENLAGSSTPDPTTNALVEAISENAPATKYDEDDTNILRNFLNRVQANKEAKAKTIITKRKRSFPHSPMKLPLESSDATLTFSPTQAKDEFDISLSAQSPAKRKKRNDTLANSECGSESQSIRRSGRTRLPVKTAMVPALSFIPVRRLGQDADNTVTLRRNEEKDLAALTKVNTRKNKGAALPALDLLEKLAQEKEDPASRHQALKQKFTEKKKVHTGKKKNVVWAEEIAEYSDGKKPEPKIPAEAEQEKEASVAEEKKSSLPVMKAAVEEKKKAPSVKVGVRSSRIAMGMAVTGTPAPKRKVKSVRA